MVILGELSAVEAEALVAASVASFLEDLVASGIDRDAATTATDDYVRRLLPDGVLTEGHRFRSIEDDGREVGRLWFGPIRESPGDWYLFELDVDEDVRRQGVGGAALKAAIGELDLLMVTRVGLNVSESNTAAVALYESLGFEPGNVSESGREMWRQLRAPR